MDILHGPVLQFAKAAWSSIWRRKRHAPPATTSYISHTRCSISASIAPCRTLCTNWCQSCKKVASTKQKNQTFVKQCIKLTPLPPSLALSLSVSPAYL